MFALFLSFSLSETRPALTWQQCTKSGCTGVAGSITSDANWRGTPRNADLVYTNIGVTSDGKSLSQKYVIHNSWGDTVGSRLYLLAPGGQAYQLFKLINKELTYDINLAQIPCGLNAAFYTVEMAEKGSGVGATYGDGYCDGNYVGGRACAELDIAETNRAATVYTTHACKQLGQFTQTGQCYSNGCGFNPYRYDKTFYGQGSSFQVDTSKVHTVVTQFISTDGTDAGDLKEIRRLYVQGGKVIKNVKASIGGGSYDSVTDDFCKASGATVNADTNLKQMGASLKRGHVLVFALWDSTDGMAWLDAKENGPCTGSETASVLRRQSPDATVTYSNLKFGDLDSTY
jgi:hypothetical protein